MQGGRLRQWQGIDKEGLKGFPEMGSGNREIYVVGDPISAAFHSFYMGSGDTFRDYQTSVDLNDPVVILKVDLSKLDPQTCGFVNTDVGNEFKFLMNNFRHGADMMGMGLASYIPKEALSVVVPDIPELQMRDDGSDSTQPEYDGAVTELTIDDFMGRYGEMAKQVVESKRGLAR